MSDFRPLEPGMGQAVADRTITRQTDAGRETWGKVADRVALGNVLTAGDRSPAEYERLRDHIAQFRVALSGRHLQHGDISQPDRPMEVFTNCSTAALGTLLKYLLLNGSGVGSSYDDDLMVVDWTQAPLIVPVLPEDHADYADATYQREGKPVQFLSPERALRLLDDDPHHYFRVPDSREGWAKAVEQVERMAFQGRRRDILVLDFSDVRPKGAPIAGMQGRPSSGPVPLMQAFMAVNAIRGAEMERWEARMRVDHELAAVVAVGGARRAARMATKWWMDPGIFKFINIKQEGGLWSANNSVTVDADFWQRVRRTESYLRSPLSYEGITAMDWHALKVFEAVVEAQYQHGTGEPGFINVDRLVRKDEGMEVYDDGHFAGNGRFQLDPESVEMSQALVRAVKGMKYPYIVNPCGEIVLFALGGYCVIGDVVPFFADTLQEAEDAFRATTRALMRVNCMESLYAKEVARTNRIGVSITGIFEAAWKHFGLTFRDLLDEDVSGAFWRWVEQMREAVKDEATKYAAELGVSVPHTFTTIKPAGTTSKLHLLTEGAHLPPMEEYVRWNQYLDGDPLIAELADKGYPTKKVAQYPSVTLVGFPVQPMICRLGIPREYLVTAPEATVEEQYRWVSLLEQYWLGADGNQVSYTLKYRPEEVGLEEYRELILTHQANVRCLSVMPSSDWKQTAEKYGYVPEQPVSQEEFIQVVENITDPAVRQTVSLEELQCASGACPI